MTLFEFKVALFLVFTQELRWIVCSMKKKSYTKKTEWVELNASLPHLRNVMLSMGLCLKFRLEARGSLKGAFYLTWFISPKPTLKWDLRNLIYARAGFSGKIKFCITPKKRCHRAERSVFASLWARGFIFGWQFISQYKVHFKSNSSMSLHIFWLQSRHCTHKTNKSSS